MEQVRKFGGKTYTHYGTSNCSSRAHHIRDGIKAAGGKAKVRYDSEHLEYVVWRLEEQEGGVLTNHP